MTSNVELLPLPKWLLEGFTDPTIEMLCDYTRDNVEHYVKELQEEVARVRGLWGDAETHCHKLYDQNAAKDAELVELRSTIEVLRAELREMRRTMVGEFKRAEQLAEALRAVVADMREWGEPAKGAHVERIQRRLDDALRDHDQEEK